MHLSMLSRWGGGPGKGGGFDCNHRPGVLLEAGTRVPAPVYSEHSTRLCRNEVSSRQILN